jgi:hypothetical protein
MRVLVCDDELRRSAEIASRIRDAGQPDPEQLFGNELTEELKNLFHAVTECFEGPKNFRQLSKTRFKEADMVILDNNLALLNVTGTRLTAESIAGYIRAFTGASYIVSLNKNPGVDFDLRYLVGDYSTRADLAINDNHLENPALWNGERANAKDGFLPWYWPRLENAVDRRRRQIKFVSDHLDDSVIETLDFDYDSIGFLSPHATGALSTKAELDGATRGGVSIKELTYRDVFIASDRSLPAQKERQRLSKAEKKGNRFLRKIISRVVAADIDLWFRRDVLGPQVPLVDVPHLLVRLPFLLGTKASKPNEWNKSATSNAAPYGLKQQLYNNHLAPAKFKHSMWVPAACFWWPKLKADEKLNELFLAAKATNWVDVVFCEDTSSFVERSPKTGTAPIEFPAEMEGAWERRHIAPVHGYHYAPRSRLAI